MQPPTTFRRSSTSLITRFQESESGAKVRKQSVNHLFCSETRCFAVKDAIYYARQEDEEEVEEESVQFRFTVYARARAHRVWQRVCLRQSQLQDTHHHLVALVDVYM